MLPIFDSILGIINKFIPDKDKQLDIAKQLEQEFTKQMELKHNIIASEIKNGSGIWRVRLMYLCMFMVTAHFTMYDIIPYIRTTFDLNFWIPAAPDNTELWSFLKIGVGGYLTSRGVEKSVAWWKSGK
jgi:hypothetical protein